MSSSTSVGIQSAVAVELVASAPKAMVEEIPVEEPLPMLPPPPKIENDFVKPVENIPKPKKVTPSKKQAIESQPNKEVPKNETLQVAQEATSLNTGELSARPSLGGESTTSASPDYLRNPPPPYPRESRYNQEEGTVLLSVSLDSAGVVEAISIKETSRFNRLDEAAIKAVKSWKFKPAKVAGIGVSSSILVPVKFVLR